MLGTLKLNPIIDEFHSKLEQLKSEVSRDHIENVRALDSELSALYEQILGHEPQSREEYYVLARFFVDQLRQLEPNTRSSDRVADKLMTLIEQCEMA